MDLFVLSFISCFRGKKGLILPIKNVIINIMMKNKIIFAFFLVVFCVFAYGDYVLGPYDVLAISVQGIEELNIEGVLVRDDGSISFPLIGDIEAEGLTIKQLQEVMEDELEQYVLNPRVFIVLTEPGGKVVYVFGDTQQSGYVKVPRENGNILHAISQVGGFDLTTANLKRVRVLRKNGEVFYVNVKSMLRKRDKAEVFQVKNGDVIYVPRKNIILNMDKIMQFLTLITLTISVQEALK